MTTHMIARFGDWYDALPWPQAALVLLGLIVVTAALVFLGVQLFAYLALRALRREIREPAWHLDAPTPPPRECEAYCRICQAYTVTAETYCVECAQQQRATPLLLFSDAVDMAAHMARTFPLPRRDQEHFSDIGWTSRTGRGH